MDKHISVPIFTDKFIELANFLKERNDPQPPSHVIGLAIDLWMIHADDNADLLEQTDTQGYKWKNLFLPASTQIRMQYKGEYFYAKVEGSSIIYNGKSISPGTLANTIAGGSRNAWRDLWVKRAAPHGDKEWCLADDLRRPDESQVKLLKLVNEKGEEAVTQAIESGLRKHGIGMEEGEGKRVLDSLRASFG